MFYCALKGYRVPNRSGVLLRIIRVVCASLFRPRSVVVSVLSFPELSEGGGISEGGVLKKGNTVLRVILKPRRSAVWKGAK